MIEDIASLAYVLWVNLRGFNIFILVILFARSIKHAYYINEKKENYTEKFLKFTIQN